VPADALGLALAAAFLHALWNLLLARSPDVQAATACTFALAVVVYAPVAALTWEVEAAALPYVAASSALELAYLVLLAAAYGRADLSVVYPTARGLAPVLVLGATVVVLGEPTSVAEAAGVLLVAAGVLAVRGLGSGRAATGVGYGVLLAVCIAAYTVVDSRGVRHANPLAYLELVMALPAIVYLAVVVRRRGARAVRAQLRPATFVAALATFGAFGLALAALQRASAASVAAVRETSVVIAVALAGLVLHERVGAARLVGAVLVVAGVVLVTAG
jgi:drug/metabolite transporter (DMT)-like permease